MREIDQATSNHEGTITNMRDRSYVVMLVASVRLAQGVSCIRRTEHLDSMDRIFEKQSRRLASSGLADSVTAH